MVDTWKMNIFEKAFTGTVLVLEVFQRLSCKKFKNAIKDR